MAASPDGVHLFNLIVGLARYKPRNEPEKITPFEQYVLVDALSFFMSGTVFPQPAPPVTYLQYLFILEGYKVYHEGNVESIYGPTFEAGMKGLSKVG